MKKSSIVFIIWYILCAIPIYFFVKESNWLGVISFLVICALGVLAMNMIIQKHKQRQEKLRKLQEQK